MPANNTTWPLENIIYGGFVKYDRLQPIVFNTFSNTSIAAATNLNVFIDCYSILKSLFSESYRTDITDYTAITSGLINMCSHYRGFFKGLGVHTKFYLVWSFNTHEDNRKLVAGYNDEFFRKSQIKLFNEVAMNNFDLLDLLCPYLPDIFFVRTEKGYESAVLIAGLIEKLNDGQPNLIISKDLYPLQLCSLYPYTSYLYPKKSKGGPDMSIMVPISEKYSYRSEFWNLVATIRKVKVDDLCTLSPLNFPLFSAINKFPERMINGLVNVKGAVKIIKKIVGEEDIQVIEDQLWSDDEIPNLIPVALVANRVKALDVKFMLNYYRNDPEYTSIQLQNLRDDGTVNMINSKFFSHNPLDLTKL